MEKYKTYCGPFGRRLIMRIVQNKLGSKFIDKSILVLKSEACIGLCSNSDNENDFRGFTINSIVDEDNKKYPEIAPIDFLRYIYEYAKIKNNGVLP